MNIENLVKIKWKKIEESSIIYYPEVEDFCKRPYKNHPKGCPNREKCKNLGIPYFGQILNAKSYQKGIYNHFYLLYAEFDFKTYKKYRKKQNPNFFNSEGRIKCCLYWQKSVKKCLQDCLEEIWRINTINNNLKDWEFYVLGSGSGINLSFQEEVGSMENACINVFSTLKINNIHFELKPENKIILCYLICSETPLLFKSKIKCDIQEWL